MRAFNVAYFMHIGLREEQEDCLFVNGTVVQEKKSDGVTSQRIETESLVCAVCDGMGGHEQGEWASRFVCDRLGKKLEDAPSPGESVVGFLKEIQWEIEAERVANTGTTIAGVVIEDRKAFVFNAGDSRVFKVGPKGITYLSHDHSLVQRELDTGNLTPEEAFHHPFRNMIEFGIGDVFRTEWDRGYLEIVLREDVLEKDEFYLLCTDGVSDMLRESEIYSLLAPNPLDNVGRLIDAVTERMKDNFSVIIIGNA